MTHVYTHTIRAAMAALVLGMSLLTYGCGGSTPAPEAAPPAAPASADTPAPKWAFAAKALELTFVSDPFLNEYDGSAHALSVSVYQLSDPAPFRELAATATGLARLGNAENYGPSVVSVRRLNIQPGRNEVLTFDRDEKARYVAVACDFYGRARTTATRVFEIPVDQDTTGWLLWKETVYSPGKLARKIVLGRTGIIGDGS